MQLVLDTTGLRLGVRNGCFHIVHEEEQRQISPKRITSIHVTAAISVSSPALLLAVAHEIPVVFSDHMLHATLRSAAYKNLPKYRHWQLLHAESGEALRWMRRLLAQKVMSQWQNLHEWRTHARNAAVYVRLSASLREGADALFRADDHMGSKEALRGAEAVSAQYYWDAVACILPEDYEFTARQFRPAQDFFNAALNYWYGMLYNSVESAIWATGLDAACGLLHAEDYNTPALCYDLIEPFRPWADAALVPLCHAGKLLPEHFEPHGDGLWLSKAGRTLIIPLYGQWLQEKAALGGRVTQRKNHILQAPAALLKHIRDIYEQSFRS